MTAPTHDDLLARFSTACSDGGLSPLRDFLAEAAGDADTRLELACLDLQARLRRREAARVEEYLTLLPELAADRERFADFIEWEYLCRRKVGLPVGASEYADRFPHLLPELGRLLSRLRAGRLALLGEIASGGMGTVYRAHDPTCQRTLAVKTLQPVFRGDPVAERRFLNEGLLTARLQHPGVPPVHDLGRLDDGRPFLAMKLVEGQTLAELLDSPRTPTDPTPDWIGIFARVCETMAYAHGMGVVHRDLKPENIMVGAHGEVQVMDWGLARGPQLPAAPAEEMPEAGASVRLTPPRDPETTQATTVVDAPDAGPLSDPGAQPTALSVAGKGMGTPAYMPPEQALGRWDEVDARADVFALGAILCRILTGKPPYDGPGVTEVLDRARRGDLAEAWARLDRYAAERAEGAPELAALALKCLAKELTHRPANAELLSRALSQFQAQREDRRRQAELASLQAAERAEAARVVAVAERKARRRIRLLATMAVIMVAAGAGGAFWWRGQEAGLTAAFEQAAQEAEGHLARQDAANSLEELSTLIQGAQSAAERADSLAAGMFAPLTLRDRAAGLRAAVDEARQALAADVQLVETLQDSLGGGEFETARFPYPVPQSRLQAESPGSGIPLVPSPPELVAEEHFRQAFLDWGLDLAGGPADQLAGRLLVRPRVVRAQVASALDAEATIQRSRGKPDLTWATFLYALADAVDPDPGNRTLRELLQSGNLVKEKLALKVVQGLLPPGLPVALFEFAGSQRDRLRQLANSVDPRQASPQYIMLLVRSLMDAGESASTEQLLRKTTAAQPHEPLLLHVLGDLLRIKASPESPESIECYRAMRAARPTLGMSLAMSFLRAGRTTEAVDVVRDVLRRRRLFFDGYLALSFMLNRLGDFDGAVSVCEEARRYWPEHPMLLLNLAVALSNKGKEREAKSVYVHILQIQPNYLKAQYNLGISLLTEGNVVDAQKSFEQMIRHERQFVPAYLGLAHALFLKSDYAGATEVLRRAVAIGDRPANVHWALGINLSKQRDFKAAVREFELSLRSQTDNPKERDKGVYTCLGQTLMSANNLHGAEEAYQKALEIDRLNATAHLGLGRLYTRQRRLPEAEVELIEAVRLEPGSSFAHLSLGFVQFERKNHYAAEGSLRKMLTLPGRERQDEFTAWMYLGVIYCDHWHRPEDAAVAFEQAVRLQDGSVAAHFNLARAWSFQYRYPESVLELQKAIALDPEHLDTRMSLGDLLFDMGRFREAERVFRDVVRRRRDHPGAGFYLGRALLRQGRFGEARTAYGEGLSVVGDEEEMARKYADAIKEAEAMARDNAELLAGKVKRPNPDAAMRYAQISRFAGRPLAAVDLYASGFTAAPQLKAQNAVEAAKAAVLGAAGGGRESEPVTDEKKVELRRLALEWLRIGLTSVREQASREGERAELCRQLQSWRFDPAFTGVRDESQLARLPEAERAEWRQFWQEVETLPRRLAR